MRRRVVGALIGFVLLVPVVVQSAAAQDVVHEGDNRGSVDDDGEIRSGDAASGSQILGVTSSGGEKTVRATNRSRDSRARSGDAEAIERTGPLRVGSLAATDDDCPLDPVEVCIARDGDDTLELQRRTSVTTGDALAGSQVIGVGGRGVLDLEAEAASAGAEAVGGDVVSSSVLGSIGVGTDVTTVDLSERPDDEATAVLGHSGDNDAVYTDRTDLRTGDAIAGSQVAGVVVDGIATMRLSNTADDPEATGGDVTARVETAITECVPHPDTGEPVCGAGAIAVGLDAAGAQDGDTDFLGRHEASVATGDAIAGSQIAGATVGGRLTVEASNRSDDDAAEAGSAGVTSFALRGAVACDEVEGISACHVADAILRAGPPIVRDDDPAGTDETDIGDEGGALLDRSETGSTGDAIAGTQTIGAVVSGEATLALANTSSDGNASSGDVTLSNDVARAAAAVACQVNPVIGPFCVPGDDDFDPGFDPAEPGDVVLPRGFLGQRASASSGDASAGAQTTGVVVAGSARVVASNEAEDADAASGDATASNEAFTNEAACGEAGGEANCDAGELLGGNAFQTASSSTGDAQGGLQVVGAVVAGTAEVNVVNRSTDDRATSGSADAANLAATADAGCVTGGSGATECDSSAVFVNTDDVFVQSTTANTGAALTGVQTTGVVAAGRARIRALNVSRDGRAGSGRAESAARAALADVACVPGEFAVCDGAEALVDDDVFQGAHSSTGDAVASSQTTGIVVAGTADIDLDAIGLDALARSGDADAAADAIQPSAACTAPGESASCDNADARAVDDVVQRAVAGSGDALAGAQVTGVVAAGTADVIGRLDTMDADAASGDAAAAARAGIAVVVCGQDNCGAGGVNVAGDLSQSGIAQTGDALAGSQVTGVVAPGRARADVGAASRDDTARSGDAETTTAAVLGAAACSPDTPAGNVDCTGAEASTREGTRVLGGTAFTDEADLDFDQLAEATTGDALAGSQITGAVSEGDLEVAARSASRDGDATSGDAVSSVVGARAAAACALAVTDDQCAAADARVHAGPLIDADSSSVAFVGTAELDLDEVAVTETGDAVAGGQLTGAVVGRAGDASLDLDATARSADAASGDAEARVLVAQASAACGVDLATDDVECEDTPAIVQAGPILEGDDRSVVAADESIALVLLRSDARTGDAVAGAQVTGVVAGGRAAIGAALRSDEARAATGDAEASSEAATSATSCEALTCTEAIGIVHAGPLVSAGDDTLVFAETDELELVQAPSAASGDAIAGAQVTGAVVAAGGSVDLTVRNDASDARAASGDTEAHAVAGAGEGCVFRPFDGAGFDCVLRGVRSGAYVVAPEGELVLSAPSARAVLLQRPFAASGDAVAGTQVTGVVAGGRVDADLRNRSSDDRTTTGTVAVRSVVDLMSVGPTVLAV